jgi:hypothetical protein
MTSRRSGRPCLRWRAVALAAVLSTAVTGCYTQMARNHQAASPDTRPYYCNAVGDGTPPGGHGNGNHVHPIYQGMTKGPLSWQDCHRLSNQFDAMLAAVEDRPTAGDAEATGWRNYAGYIAGLGTHHSTEMIPGTTPKPFDPTKPDFLIYDGPGDEARLAGVGYAAPGGQNPPDAFAGTNDWWHLHQRICVGNGGILAGGEEISDEECAALGGRQFDLPGEGVWLLHVWVQPAFQLRFDVFASGHPCLGEDGPLPRPDPCWEIADHDPADGPLPGDEHGGHDAHGDHDAHGA